MKLITLSADEHLIAQAEEEAKRRHTTLNALFRDRLADLAGRKERRERMSRLMQDAGNYNSGIQLTECND